jgi:hypothetical protein
VAFVSRVMETRMPAQAVPRAVSDKYARFLLSGDN